MRALLGPGFNVHARCAWQDAGECARLVGEGAHDGAEDHGGAEARDEQAADVAPVKAIVLVQRVNVGALQPVAGCMAGAVQDQECLSSSAACPEHMKFMQALLAAVTLPPDAGSQPASA